MVSRGQTQSIQSGLLLVAVAAVVVGIAGRWLRVLDDFWILFRRAIIIVILLRKSAGSDHRSHQYRQQNSF